MRRKKSLSYFKEKLHDKIDHLNLNHSFKRDLLLEALYEQEVPLSMDDLYLAVNSDLKKIVSINSVYRNIKLFVKFNLAVRTGQDGSFKYILNCLDHNETVIICEQCGTRKEVKIDQAVQHEISRVLEENGYRGDKISLKITTLCQACAGQHA